MNARRQFLIDEAVEMVQAKTSRGIEVRSERSIAKQFLLNGNFFYNGDLKEPHAKHIGLGVYILTAKSKY